MSFREFCLRCRRAQRVCQCADIRPFESKPVFVILMHPIERRKRSGTGRMTHLSLSNSILIEGKAFQDNDRVKKLLKDPNFFPVVLYPGKTATELAEFTAPDDRRLLIFVLDATWGLARTMLNRSPNLKALPRIQFMPKRLSTFQIRQQPDPMCLSTIEAVHHLLEHFSPEQSENGFLLEAFDKMVKRQLEFAKVPSRRHDKKIVNLEVSHE